MAEKVDVLASLRAAMDTGDPVEERAALAGIEARMFGSAPPLPQVSRYTLRRRIGAGGMGVVYEGLDPKLDRVVAVKLLRAATGRPLHAARRRLVREARAMARIRHPNVIEVYDVGTVDGAAARSAAHVFVVMEYVRGCTLADWLSQTPRTVTRILQTFTEAARGLAAAHRAGLLHRDFKPHNVMVGDDGRVRVLDFGLVRAIAVESLDETADATTRLEHHAVIGEPDTVDRLPASVTALTPRGGLVGTPYYLAPELIGGSPPSVCSDIYALCVSLYLALYDDYPHRGSTVPELASAKRRDAARFPPRRGVPRRVIDLLQRGLDPEPKNRPKSVEAVLTVLETRGRRPTWPVLGGAALAITLALTAALGTDAPATDGCDAPAERLARTWDAARAQTLSGALQQRGASSGATARVQQALEEYAERWVHAVERHCGQTREQAEAQRQMACLRRREADLAASLDVLVEAEPAVARRAIDVVLKLPAPEDCIGAPAPAPPSPMRAGLAQAATSRARALLNAGSYAAAVEVAREAAKLGGPNDAATPQAHLIAGLALVQLEATDDAEQALRAAYFGSVGTNDERTAMEAAKGMAALLVGVQGRLSEGEQWLAYAWSSLERLGRPPADAAMLMLEEADALSQRGDPDAGRARAHAALNLFAASGSEDQRVHADILLRLVTFELLTERYETALATAVEARAVVEQVYTTRHPVFASAMHQSAYALGYLGREAEAIAAYDESIDVLRWLEGPNSMAVARSLNNRSVMRKAAGDLQRAAQDVEAAVKILDANEIGPAEPLRFTIDINRALLLLETGQPRQALDAYQELLARIESSAEPIGGSSVGLLHHNMARAEKQLGDLDAARARYEMMRSEGLDERLSASTRAEVRRAMAELLGEGDGTIVATSTERG